MAQSIEIPIPIGELFDKITILEIKVERLTDAAKVANAGRELAFLCQRRDELLPKSAELDSLTGKLRIVNERIWDFEDSLHEFERRGTFDTEFVVIARQTYQANDERAVIKRQISLLLGSDLIEEKSHDG